MEGFSFPNNIIILNYNILLLFLLNIIKKYDNQGNDNNINFYRFDNKLVIIIIVRIIIYIKIVNFEKRREEKGYYFFTGRKQRNILPSCENNLFEVKNVSKMIIIIKDKNKIIKDNNKIKENQIKIIKNII